MIRHNSGALARQSFRAWKLENFNESVYRIPVRLFPFNLDASRKKHE